MLDFEKTKKNNVGKFVCKHYFFNFFLKTMMLYSYSKKIYFLAYKRFNFFGGEEWKKCDKCIFFNDPKHC